MHFTNRIRNYARARTKKIVLTKMKFIFQQCAGAGPGRAWKDVVDASWGIVSAQQNHERVLHDGKAYLLSTLKLFSPHHFSRSVSWPTILAAIMPWMYGAMAAVAAAAGAMAMQALVSRLVSTTAYIMLCFADVLHISLFVWRLALHVCDAHLFVSIVFVTAYFVIHMYFTVMAVVVVGVFIHTRRRETFQWGIIIME